ncbi:MAG: aminopeptidase P family protein [Candidatus Lokiarchaeota archaeon]|nr:aminopeptidase P family protein [Candidatus Lokiarchaeota archaeon]
MSLKLKSITSPPSSEELSNRLKNIRRLMKEQNLDYYISFNPVNIYYLTNFAFYVHERPFILIIENEGLPKMVIPRLEKGHFESRVLCELEFVVYYEFPAQKGENWNDYYQEQIRGDATVGIESELPIGIANKTPGKKIVTDIIDETRIIKTDYEIGRIYHACRVVNKGHRVLLKKCRPKVLEFALYKEVTDSMTSKIVQDIPHANFRATQTTGAVWPPSISHDPHLIPHIFKEMEEGGPHVSIVSAQVDGYGVEIERTFFLGHVPEETIKPFEVMFEARALAYSMLKPGIIMSEVDKKVRKLITEKSYGDYIIHRTGHGLGITGHEAPYLAEGYDKPLEKNMVISVEPGIYIPGIGGFRHSDTVLITEEGYQKLTKAPETLEEVTISL